jgi:hypothetical protein
MRGLPDIIGCYAGKFYGMEVKLPGKENTLTAIQQYRISEINKNGGKAIMITSIEEALKFVK